MAYYVILKMVYFARILNWRFCKNFVKVKTTDFSPFSILERKHFRKKTRDEQAFYYYY